MPPRAHRDRAARNFRAARPRAWWLLLATYRGRNRLPWKDWQDRLRGGVYLHRREAAGSVRRVASWCGPARRRASYASRESATRWELLPRSRGGVARGQTRAAKKYRMAPAT